MLKQILSRIWAGKKASQKRVQARYDVAQSGDDNRAHWAQADALSPNAANLPQVLRTLRMRSRYEIANNTYASGMIETLVKHIVGSGPRLQMLTDSKVLNSDVENRFLEWSEAVGLSEKLTTMQRGELVSGEVFATLSSNPKLITPSQLDLNLLEPDQIATPHPYPRKIENLIDGIEFDKYGNPVNYLVLDQHPGEIFRVQPFKFRKIRAENMIHLFRPDRPGQRRGVPRLTPALPLFAQLRRYTLAVLLSAETAATVSGVIYTESPAADVADLKPLDQVPLERNTFLTMPVGWNVKQLKSEQPTTAYADFKRAILNEVARALELPYNIAAGDSSDYNYASGRLDSQSFMKTVVIAQRRLERIVLNRLFATWLQEMVLEIGLVPPGAGASNGLKHQWFWDGLQHVDPAKEAKAQAQRLASLTTTLSAEYAAQGKDWEDELKQVALEQTTMKELGLVVVETPEDVPSGEAK